MEHLKRLLDHGRAFTDDIRGGKVITYRRRVLTFIDTHASILLESIQQQHSEQELSLAEEACNMNQFKIAQRLITMGVPCRWSFMHGCQQNGNEKPILLAHREESLLVETLLRTKLGHQSFDPALLDHMTHAEWYVATKICRLEQPLEKQQNVVLYSHTVDAMVWELRERAAKKELHEMDRGYRVLWPTLVEISESSFSLTIDDVKLLIRWICDYEHAPIHNKEELYARRMIRWFFYYRPREDSADDRDRRKHHHIMKPNITVTDFIKAIKYRSDWDTIEEALVFTLRHGDPEFVGYRTVNIRDFRQWWPDVQTSSPIERLKYIVEGDLDVYTDDQQTFLPWDVLQYLVESRNLNYDLGIVKSQANTLMPNRDCPIVLVQHVIEEMASQCCSYRDFFMAFFKRRLSSEVFSIPVVHMVWSRYYDRMFSVSKNDLMNFALVRVGSPRDVDHLVDMMDEKDEASVMEVIIHFDPNFKFVRKSRFTLSDMRAWLSPDAATAWIMSYFETFQKIEEDDMSDEDEDRFRRDIGIVNHQTICQIISKMTSLSQIGNLLECFLMCSSTNEPDVRKALVENPHLTVKDKLGILESKHTDHDGFSKESQDLAFADLRSGGAFQYWFTGPRWTAFRILAEAVISRKPVSRNILKREFYLKGLGPPVEPHEMSTFSNRIFDVTGKHLWNGYYFFGDEHEEYLEEVTHANAKLRQTLSEWIYSEDYAVFNQYVSDMNSKGHIDERNVRLNEDFWTDYNMLRKCIMEAPRITSPCFMWRGITVDLKHVAGELVVFNRFTACTSVYEIAHGFSSTYPDEDEDDEECNGSMYLIELPAKSIGLNLRSMKRSEDETLLPDRATFLCRGQIPNETDPTTPLYHLVYVGVAAPKYITNSITNSIQAHCNFILGEAANNNNNSNVVSKMEFEFQPILPIHKRRTRFR